VERDIQRSETKWGIPHSSFLIDRENVQSC
jgi:hypothetical protein